MSTKDTGVSGLLCELIAAKRLTGVNVSAIEINITDLLCLEAELCGDMAMGGHPCVDCTSPER